MKIKLFTHTDLDGVGCAILAYLAFGEKNVDVEYCNYDDVDNKVEEFIEDGTLYRSYNNIFITDISVSDSIATMIDILDRAEKKVRLFDHHGTALRLNKYDWCIIDEPKYNPDGCIKTSGTELFYTYLLWCGPYFDAYHRNAQNNIARFVTNVRNWDTRYWQELCEDGVVSKRMNDLFHIYGREKFIFWAINRIGVVGMLLSPMHTFPYFSEEDLLLLEQEQRNIDNYIEEKNKQLTVKTNRFGNTYGVVFAERYFSELGNRLCEMHPELTYIAMIDISHGTVEYRTVRDDLNLGTEIAHNYGGGGRPKAAGSTFDAGQGLDLITGMLFDNQNEIITVDDFLKKKKILPR